jgi:predicted acetyltransferase
MQLEELGEGHESAFLEALADYQKNDPLGLTLFYARKAAWSQTEFKKYIKELSKLRLDWRPGPNKVSLTRYALQTPEGRIIASGLMRFPLDEVTENDGGNLVCDVPPSLRKRGYGSYCLALMLFEAVRAGLRRVLVTCEADNQGARKMIEKNRGTFQDIVDSKSRKGIKVARYWINFG